MKWLAEWLILCGGFVSLLATSASAQIVVQGVVQPDEVPGLQPDEVLRTERPASLPWSVTFGLREDLESNVQGAPGGTQDLGSQLHAAVARNWTFQRGDISGFGNADPIFYRQSTGLDTFLYGGGIRVSYKVSRRLFWAVSDTLSSSYAQETTVLTDSGLLPPKLLTRLNTASSALRYDVSPTTQVRWVLSEQNVTFDSSQSGPAATELGPASTLTIGVNVGRQLSRSQTLGFTEEYQRTDESGAIESTDQLLTTWQMTIGRGVTLDARGGASLYTQAGQSGIAGAPTGSVGFSVHIRTDDVLGLRYERHIEQALGEGTHVSDGVWAAYVLSLGRRLKLEASENYDRGAFPLDPTHKRNGQTSTIMVRCTVAQNMGLVIGYQRYVRLDTDAAQPSPAVSGDSATMSLTYALRR